MPDILCNYASPVSQTTLTGLSTLPGGHVTIAGERILTYGDSDTNCGIWVVVTPGAWTRATDFDTSAEVVFNQQIVPQSSDGANGIQAGSIFYVSTTGTITPGTTAFSITQRTYEEVQVPDVGITKVGNAWKQSTTGVLAGSYDRVSVDERGNVTTGSSSESATTFIEGLGLSRLSNTSFRVKEGAAYINGVGSIVDLAVDTDVTAGTKGFPASPAASTTYYTYLYSNAGVGDVEVSTQAPVSTPYRANAYEKGPDGTPDNTRRYVGKIQTDASGNIQSGPLVTTQDLVVEGWTAPTLLNSWTNAAGKEPAGYRKTPLGEIILKGCVSKASAGTVAFNLPFGYRPNNVREFVTISGGALNVGHISVGTGGDVTVTDSGAPLSTHLEGVRFYP